MQPAQRETIPARDPLSVIRKLQGLENLLCRNITDSPPAAAPGQTMLTGQMNALDHVFVTDSDYNCFTVLRSFSVTVSISNYHYVKAIIKVSLCHMSNVIMSTGENMRWRHSVIVSQFHSIVSM